MAKRKRTAGEVVAALAPGLLGLCFIAAGLGVIWYAKVYPPHRFSVGLVAGLIGIGIAMLGYWSFAN